MSRGIGIGAWQVNIFVLNHIYVKRVVFQLRIIILVSGLDGGMQSSAKDLYWFWWIMSGYLLGPRILSLLLVLCCSTKAIIFCLRSLSESIHKWILGISSFSYIVKERHFWQDLMQVKNIGWLVQPSWRQHFGKAYRFFKKPGGL